MTKNKNTIPKAARQAALIGHVIIDRASVFARAAHAGQKRKYSGEPYFNHCKNVSIMVSKVSGDYRMIAAALLHDVLEDTKVTEQDLVEVFGREIAAIVVELTDSPTEAGNREQRKALDRQRLENASAVAQTIKLADLIDNTFSIVGNDPKFAKVYLKEKELLLAVLTRGNKTLYDKAVQILKDSQEQLNVQ